VMVKDMQGRRMIQLRLSHSCDSFVLLSFVCSGKKGLLKCRGGDGNPLLPPHPL
jgi:hypothetical protein